MKRLNYHCSKSDKIGETAIKIDFEYGINKVKGQIVNRNINKNCDD